MGSRALRHYRRMTSRRTDYLRPQDSRFFSDLGQVPLSKVQVFDLATEGEFSPRWVSAKYARVWVGPWHRQLRRIRPARLVEVAPAVGADCWFALDSGLMNLELLEAASDPWSNEDLSQFDYDSRDRFDWDPSFWDHHNTLEDDEREAAQDKREQEDRLWFTWNLEKLKADLDAFQAEVEFT